MKNQISKTLIFILAISLLVASVTGCAPKKSSFTIGVVSPAPSMEPVLQGFKDAMAEKGYIEGQNVTYIYNGPLGADAAKLEAEVQSFIDAKVDLILALATPATVAAKKITAGTNIPVVFAPISDPVGAGFAESLTKPGGNMTGIKSGGFVGKELEWLLIVKPDTKKVFAPYNPKDGAAVFGRNLLLEAGKGLGVEVITPEANTPEEVPTLLASMPEDVDAIFMLSDSMILSRITDFVATASAKKLPLTSINISQVQAGALMAYGPEFTSVGRQSAGLADQVLKGAAAGSLPIEEAEYFLSLNQKTADSIGLSFPDQALKAAAEIVR